MTWPVDIEGEVSTTENTAASAPVHDAQPVRPKQDKKQSPKKAWPSVDETPVTVEASCPDDEDEPEVVQKVRTPRPRKTPSHLRDYVCRAAEQFGSISEDPGGSGYLSESLYH